MATRPAFDGLPLLEPIGIRHAWDVHGPDDEIGTLNLITPDVRRTGLASARTGEVVNLTLPLDEPDPPLFGTRQPYRHVRYSNSRNSQDDYLDGFYLQGSTQFELFDLREPSRACAQRGEWAFTFVAVPLNVPGGIGSPGNAVAIP